MIQFLIDECLSPKLVEVATRFGHVAHHVQYRQWQSRRDDALLAFIRAEDRTRENNTFRGTEEQSHTEELRDVFLLASSV